MLNKNEDYIFEIRSQGYEGEGIAKTEEGYTVFIPGALKGETVKAKIVKVKKNYSYGKLLEVIEEAPNRQLAPCAVYKSCGGCNLQHTTYERQLELKQERVMDCISKIGGLDPSLVLPTIGMENPFRYRNKVQLPVGIQKGKLHIGFFASRSHNIVDTPTCLIQDEAADRIVEIIRTWIKKNKIKPYIVDGEYSKDGELRHIMVRRGFKTDEVMVVLIAAKKTLPALKELVENLTTSMPSIKSIMLNYNPKATNVIMGEESAVLFGEDHITDYIGNFRFKISPLSFFQVNPVQTEVLYGKALEYAALTGEETVFDAYCGTGTISLFLSQKAKKVYGVEIVSQAIENAKENANDNNVDNAEFFVGEAEKVIPQLIKTGVQADVVVVDPPRKGCGRELLDSIGDMYPKRIVYVSCDPSTLARDLAILEERGYRTQKVQPVDMFPMTAHVETVTLLSH